MADVSQFGARLKQLREAAGITQQQLADRCGLSKDGVAQMEWGRRKPSWETVVSLCEALSVSCEEFRKPPAEREPPAPGRPATAKEASAEEQPKRPRGRPRKQAVAAMTPAEPQQAAQEAHQGVVGAERVEAPPETPKKKPRGRPKKGE